MSNKTSPWEDCLIKIGLETYYEEHQKILDEMAPDGKFDPKKWNEASAEAIIRAVAAMIEKNNTPLLTETDCSRDEP